MVEHAEQGVVGLMRQILLGQKSEMRLADVGSRYYYRLSFSVFEKRCKNVKHLGYDFDGQPFQCHYLDDINEDMNQFMTLPRNIFN